MDYLCFSIWIYEMVLANFHGVYNCIWKQISMHLYERWSRLYHCGEKNNLKYRRYHSECWVLHYIGRRKEAKPKHFLNPSPDSRCRLIRSLRLPLAELLHHGGLHPQLWATQSLPSCRNKKTRNWANSVLLKGRAKIMTSLCSAPLTRKNNQKNCILSMGKWRPTQSSIRRRKGSFITSNPYLSLIVFCILLMKLFLWARRPCLKQGSVDCAPNDEWLSQTHKVLAIFQEMIIAQRPSYEGGVGVRLPPGHPFLCCSVFAIAEFSAQTKHCSKYPISLPNPLSTLTSDFITNIPVTSHKGSRMVNQ